MGRTSSARAEADPAVELAQWLRSLRQRAGLTYQQMAHTTLAGFAPATLWRAARGTTLPRWPVVEAFASVCGGDLEQPRRMWAAAAEQRRSLRSSVPGNRSEPALRPEFIRNPAQLLQAMRAMQIEAGGLSLRELEDRATSHGVTLLPHSTVGAVLRGERMPSRMLLIHFVEACGVSRAPAGAWEDAYRQWATGRSSRSVHRSTPGAQHDNHQHVRAA
ncbi:MULTISPECIES: helix-turn-helix transcriptional regulator [Streptomyces]|uniref:helix-turn-helix transcriptional regulator n=1 Tax=Streptomyces lycopersici TaxID=2974589 RepID=UPI0021D02120|nr:helix-turn-helix transcriptional regulator [Streptomyces sp. NEAU-383]